MSAACVWTGKSRPSSRTAPWTTSAPTPTLQTVSPPSAGEAVEANNFFAEVATATLATADVDDTPTKIWNGFGELPNYKGGGVRG